MTQTVKKETQKFRITPPGYRYSRWRWAIPAISETISGTALVFMPALVAATIERFSSGNESGGWALIWALVGIVIFLSVNEKIGWGTCFRTIVMLERDWRLYAGSLIPGSALKGDPGAIVAVINKDTKNVANILQPMNQAFSAFAIAFFGTLQLWVLSPVIALAGLGGITLTIVVLTQISKILEKRAEIFRDKIGTNTSKASDIATSIRTIVGLGASKTMLWRYTDSAVDVRTSQLAYERVHSWQGAFRVFLIGCTTTLTTALALRGQFIEGSWVADIPASQLVTVAGVISMMISPIWAVEMFLMIYRNAKVAQRRIMRLQEQVEQDPPAHPVTEAVPRISIEPQTDRARVVHYLNPRAVQLTAQEFAENLASTLRSASSQPEQILFSEPNPMIFAGTLEQHVQLGSPDLSEQEKESYLQLTDSLEIAHRLGGTDPHNYWGSAINAEGSNLSGGQRQRLALARAYAQKKPVLVLTEPVNSVDEPSQQFIFDRLEEYAGRPGALEHLSDVYIISSTLEVDRRIARDALESESRAQEEE